MYTSKLPSVVTQLQQATDAALIACGDEMVGTMQRTIPPDYYTGGKWSTGLLTASIHRGEPFDGSAGRAIQYGTDRMYALFWEVGFHQRLRVWFSKKTQRWYSAPGPTRFVRKEIWLPTLFASTAVLQSLYTQVFRSRFGGGAGGGVGARAAAP